MMRDTDAIDQERRRRGADLTAELRDAISFPPLPPSPAEVGDLVLQTREHVQALGWGNREQLYTASQVRAIMSECAILAAARERERCARMADGVKFKDGSNDARRGPLSVGTWHENSPMGYAMRELARAIRGA